MFLLTRFSQGVLLILLVALLAPTAQAGMSSLTESELSDVAGAGIAIALDDFAYMMAPTSYFEQVGITPSNACTGYGNTASNLSCWRRGDLRWFGVSITAATEAGSHWGENACSASDFMSCPRGGPIANFSPFDNPYLMRAQSPSGIDYQGDPVNGDLSAPDKTIYEFLAPSSQPDYMFSFWGEIEAGATRDSVTEALATNSGRDYNATTNPGGGGLLQTQTLIRGNAAGSIFRLFKFTETGITPRYGETFGIIYTSHLQGDFRFSAAQTDSSPDAIGEAPQFQDIGGLYFRDVEAFIPLGQLYYQALVLNAIGTDGGFSVELTQVPNNSSVYTTYYGRNAGDTRGFSTVLEHLRFHNTPCSGWGANTQNCTNYRASHGHVRYGDWHPDTLLYSSGGSSAGNSGIAAGDRNLINGYVDSDSNPTNGDDGDGIFFRACAGCGAFNAFAQRTTRIDKRGENQSMHRTQNYNCNSGGTGGCTVSGNGPVAAGPGDSTRTFPTMNVNLGDARMEGLLINRFELISCQAGGC
jgi:hypothetical protein